MKMQVQSLASLSGSGMWHCCQIWCRSETRLLSCCTCLCPQLGLEVSPSTLFAVASILEGCAFLNGSPQNTLVPGALELAWQRRVFVGGDDFKSGQTKVKSVLVDFLIGSGLKVCEPGRVFRSG